MIRPAMALIVLLAMFVPAGTTQADPTVISKPAVVLNTARRTGSRAHTVPEPPPEPFVVDPTQAVFELVNAERSARGLAPLRVSPILNQVALDHSLNQAADGRIYHIDPDDGSKAGMRISRAGYAWRTWGENVVAGHPAIAAAMRRWMSSPNHCRNILNPGFTEIGIGYVSAGRYWTHLFARPVNQPPPAQAYDPTWC